jgi:hypothetical protein
VSSSDEIMADARAAYRRITGEDEPIAATRDRRQQAANRLGRKLARIAIADAAILVAAVAVGLVWPLGIFGFLAVLALMVATTAVLAFSGSAPRALPPERLRASELKTLPAATGRWLEAQRPALPAPARTLSDQIGVRLETLQFQMAGLDESAPVAAEVRKLVGEQLPEFVRDYQKVPANLRATPRNGKTPDAQLADGLKVIDGELAQLSEQLAQGDLDTLATRGRYLELKYQGQPE